MTDTDATTVPPRSAIPVERTWNAESVFATDAAWEEELESVLADLTSAAAFEGRLADGPVVLAEALAARDALERRLGRVLVYATIAWAVETTDPVAVARYGRAQAANAQIAGALAFVEPEVLGIGRDRLRDWSRAHPPLHAYEHYFDDLDRRRRHTRSAEVEEVLGLLADVASGPFTAYSGLVDSDLQFSPAVAGTGETFAVSQGTVDALLAHPDRSLRRSAWESYADGHLGLRNALAANLGVAVKHAVFSKRVRRHTSTLGAALSPSNLPVAVFDNLIATFEANLPTWHRYWRIRGSQLGVDAFKPYDVVAPLSDDRPEFEYEQCVEWICASLTPLGDDYVRVVRSGCFEDRWVDMCPSAGKMSGAFSSGAPGTHPFVVMTFDGTAVALGTLAHELGHSMHSYLAWKTQPQVYTAYTTFVAEVASNFHQAMLRAYLLEAVPDREVQLAVLDEAMANFHRYFFLMPTLARFERRMHELVEEGEGVTADLLEDLTVELFAESFGPAVELDRARVGITWAQFPHLYEPFYVFQYATGISGANALAQGVLAGTHEAAERYLEFLAAGASAYPLDALERAGVDLSSPEPVERTYAVLTSLVDRIEALVEPG